ncbi:Protein FANTASTIC FOUR 3 [Striga hermonthica]|uniref:Protein FANTASTIC FOUR 3 n=1 Tax=Striga hermonthica TaxID=68872 RepID=A0A9N7R4Y2_STRHE|nr:Protein FANTASTIC FOUR 3 [Striga hermonthica]
MSTILCQSIVSSNFDSQSAETTTLKLKVAPPPQPSPPATIDFFKNPAADRSTNLEFGNWDFIKRETGEYFRDANPWAQKTSFSTMTSKSLQLCTENLGSESGSDIMSDSGDSIFYSPPSVEHSSPQSRELIGTNRDPISNPQKNPNRREAKSYPPPLTTMNGACSLQVRRHREGGRLIIEAVETPFRNAYLQAERSDGRLRLSYMTAEATNSAAEEDEDETAPEEEEEEEEIEEAVWESDEEFELNGKMKSNLEGELEKYLRVRRCKEEGRAARGSNWRPAHPIAIS